MLQKAVVRLGDVLGLVDLLTVQGSVISLTNSVTSSFFFFIYFLGKNKGVRLGMIFAMTVSQTIAELHVFLCSFLLA